MPTKSQVQRDELRAGLKARNSLFWIKTTEEARVERYIFEACVEANFVPRTWDCGDGVQGVDGKPTGLGSQDIGETLTAIRSRSGQGNEKGVWVLRDAHKWLDDRGGMPAIVALRQLRNLARQLSNTPVARAQAIIIISPNVDVPPELEGHAVVIDWPIPDRQEIAEVLDDIVKAYGLDLNGTRDACIDSAVGLTGEEASACFAKSLVQTKRIDPAVVAQEKKRVISKDGLLEWMDPLEGGFDQVGGLDVIKSWVANRLIAFTAKARAYGLKALKGIFLAGISGCGKTFIAKAIAWALGRVPLIRLDLGALKSKFVGESEQNLRKAFKTIEAVGRCVVLLDEVEKALQGATGGAADGGVSADALGALLTWMQERTSEAFVVATANDIITLAEANPEFLRKGRWDEVFWVDLPTTAERAQIIAATLKGVKREPSTVDLDVIADATDGFSGAELASLIPEALFVAFADGEREPTTEDILAAAKTCVPLSKTAKPKIDRMRDWAKERARPASTPETAQATVTGTRRVLDVA